MLQGRQNFAIEWLFRSMEAIKGELFAVLDDEERKLIEFQMLLGSFYDEICAAASKGCNDFAY